MALSRDQRSVSDDMSALSADRGLATKVRELKVLKGERRVASCAKAYTAAKRALRRAERHVAKVALKAEAWQ